MEEKKAFDEKVSKRVDDLIAGASGVEFRNVASSRNQTALKDDRSTDAEQLYKDAERLAKELKNAQTESDDDFAAEPVARKEEKKAEEDMNIRNGMNFAKKVLSTGECNLLILDEVLGLIEKNIISVEDVENLLNQRGETDVILTGISLNDEICSLADEVSKIETLKFKTYNF